MITPGQAVSEIARDRQKLSKVGDKTGRLLLSGVCVSVLLVGGFGTWGAAASLAGAILTQGTVIVDTSDKKVQHPTGGVVGAILVNEGDRVNTGDVLVRLDET